MGLLKKKQAETRRIRKSTEKQQKEREEAAKKEQMERRNLALRLAMLTNPYNVALPLRGTVRNLKEAGTILAAKYGKLLIEYASRGKLQEVKQCMNRPEFKLQLNSPKEYVTHIRNICSQAFVEAYRKRQMDVVTYLFQTTMEPVPRVDPTFDNNSAIRNACYYQDIELFNMLMDWRGSNGERVDPSTENNVCIEQAVSNRNFRMVKRLLADERVDPTSNTHESLQIAVNIEEPGMVKMLLDWRGSKGQFVDPTIFHSLLLIYAVKDNQPAIVRMLLQWRHTDGDTVLFVDPREDDAKSLRKASEKGYLTVVNMLLAWRGPNGERVDPTSHDNEAIRSAVYHGHTRVAQRLRREPGIEQLY
jgi:hypothetical protein